MIRNLADTPSSLHDSRQWGTRSRRDAHREPPRRKTDVHRREGPENGTRMKIISYDAARITSLTYSLLRGFLRAALAYVSVPRGAFEPRVQNPSIELDQRDNGTSSQRTLGRRSSVLRLQFLSPRTSTYSSGLTFRDDDITPAHLQCPEVSRLASLQSAMLPSR